MPFNLAFVRFLPKSDHVGVFLLNIAYTPNASYYNPIGVVGEAHGYITG